MTILTAHPQPQPWARELTALASLVSAADKLPYFTGSGSAALADFTSFARTLIAAGNAGAARTANSPILTLS